MKRVKLSEFKIIPIVSSAKRLDITDAEYFSSKYREYISNSRLSNINPEQNGSPSKYKNPPKLSTASLVLGSAIHELILQPESFNLAPKCSKPTAKLGTTIDRIKVYRQKGFSIYDSIKRASVDCDYYVNQIDSKISKIVKDGLKYYLSSKTFGDETITLSDKDWDTCTKCVDSVLSDNQIVNTLKPKNEFGIDIPSFNEDALFLDVLVTYQDKYTILSLKMKADNWTIDEENKVLTLNDLKTTSKPVAWFMNKEYGSFYHYHYHRQFALYMMMLKYYCMKEYGLTDKWKCYGNVLVVNTSDQATKLYKITKQQFEQGRLEYERLLKMVAYYKINGFSPEVDFV